jgi:hypothetical protein
LAGAVPVFTLNLRRLTQMDGVLPGEEGRPGGRAQRLGVVAVEDDAVVGEGVDVGRRDLVAPVEADVVETLRNPSLPIKNNRILERANLELIFFTFYQFETVICISVEMLTPEGSHEFINVRMQSGQSW